MLMVDIPEAKTNLSRFVERESTVVVPGTLARHDLDPSMACGQASLAGMVLATQDDRLRVMVRL